MLRFLDVSFNTPEKNLAFDEALLDSVEGGAREEILRIWESPSLFVVLGVSQPLRAHVYEDVCARDKVPILRRCSAGGCVLQGPGCLNFSLVLRTELHPEIRTIRDSYCFILGKLAAALRLRGVSASHKGISDLAVGGKKISGNAQKRRKHAILHHGTLLYGMNPELMEKYLRDPVDRPQYRGTRTHRGFVSSLTLPVDELKTLLVEAFNASPKPATPKRLELRTAINLMHEKYKLNDWVHRR
ncbi:MAG: lipoate--protein ligase family protein [Candidatus Hydrogenedentes bacterium]|nr:lipoate--protein ligase family protein [Candidatus Hydrogenedentota bacterium]